MSETIGSPPLRALISGAVVRGEVPDGKIAVGVPARLLGDVTAEQKAEWQYYKDKYAELAATRYPAGLKRIG